MIVLSIILMLSFAPDTCKHVKCTKHQVFKKLDVVLSKLDKLDTVKIKLKHKKK